MYLYIVRLEWGLNPRVLVLQTRALPLGYPVILFRGGSEIRTLDTFRYASFQD